MKCANCNHEFFTDRNSCPECGHPCTNDIQESYTPSINNNVDAQQPETQNILYNIIRYVLGLVFWIVIGIILYNTIFIPHISPRLIWENGVVEDTEDEVRSYIEETTSLTEYSLSQNELSYECNKLEPENEFGKMFTQAITETDKQLYAYVFETSWNVYLNDELFTVINTTSNIACHPEIFKEYRYLKFITCDPNEKIEQHAEETEQQTLENSIKITSYELISSDYTNTGYSFVVYFDWTNNANQTESLFSQYSISAYQNGIELEPDYWNISEYSSLSEVKPGTTVHTFNAFDLLDLSSPVDVVIEPFLSDILGESGATITKTISLSAYTTPSDSGVKPGAEKAWEAFDDLDSYNYLFPSDCEYITESDLIGKDQYEVALIRNEIYARHGYIFKKEKFQSYFENQPWYSPDENFSTASFNDIEWANIEVISKYEKKMGWS